MLAQGKGRWAVSEKRIIYRRLYGGGVGGGGSLCPAPTPKSSVKFRDFDKSLSNLAILLILKTLFMSSGVDGFSLSI